MKGGLLLILVFLGLIGAFAAFGLWWWVWTWTCVGLVVGGFELASKIVTGKMLSQNFHIWKKTHRWQAVILVACMVAFVVWLAVGHLWMGW